MPVYNALNLLREVLKLLLRPLRHILNVLFLIQWNLERATVSIHTLKDLPILHACLEKGRIEREPNHLFDALMLNEGINTTFLQFSQTALVGEGAHAACPLRRDAGVSFQLEHLTVEFCFFVVVIDPIELNLDLALVWLQSIEYNFIAAESDLCD